VTPYLLPLAALILGVFVMAMLAGGASEDAYRRGRLDERSDALARALWDADNLPAPEPAHTEKESR